MDQPILLQTEEFQARAQDDHQIIQINIGQNLGRIRHTQLGPETLWILGAN